MPLTRPGWLFVLEKTVEFCIYLVDDLLENLWTILELDTVHVKDEQILHVILDPVLISLIQAGDIVDTDALLILASTLLDLADEVRYRTSEIDQKIWRIHQ